MKQFKDPTKNAVRNVIEPALAVHGFVRAKEKDFYRVRGSLIDAITFGFGRWGSEVLYIYYSVHLVEDPVTSPYTYHAGDRLSAVWHPKSHESSIASAEAIIEDLRTYAFRWFDEIGSVEKYEGAWFDSGIAAAFAAISLGEFDRARIYLADAIARKAPLIYDSGYPGWRSNEYELDQERVSKLREALEAVESGAVEEWRQRVRSNKYRELGLSKTDC